MRNLFSSFVVAIVTVACASGIDHKLIDGAIGLPLGAKFFSVLEESTRDFEKFENDPYGYYVSYESYSPGSISVGGRRIIVSGVGIRGTKTQDAKESLLDYIVFTTPISSEDDSKQIFGDLISYVQRTYSVTTMRASPLLTALTDRDGNKMTIQLNMLAKDRWVIYVGIQASEKTLKAKRTQLAQRQESEDPPP